MATCDTNYKLTSVSIGNNGQFSSSSYGHALLENILPLPGTGQRTEVNPSFPHYFAGDYSFPLLNNLMRPFPGMELSKRRQIFNYRLSRGHQVIENTLGIIAARWHIFKKPITAKSTECKKFVLAVCALHNFIMSNDTDHIYCPEKYADWEDENHIIKKGDWRKDIEDRNPAISHSKCLIQKSSPTAFKQREDLAKYFENNGAVEFQNEFIRGFRS
uniref:DDE Tnp4 domain-containing protein n=1 Tax=Bactrocera latifrons TaxID=174628 RepID=A0A0K8VY55_BACLA